MPLSLDAFRNIASSDATHGFVRANHENANKLVEFGRTGFWKFFSSAYWNKAATNDENVQIRRDFVAALKNEYKMDAASLNEIKNELGLGTNQGDVASQPLSCFKIKEILDRVDNDFQERSDVEKLLIQVLKGRTDKNTKGIIQKWLGTVNANQENNAKVADDVLISPTVVQKLHDNIKQEMNEQFQSMNKGLTIRLDKVDNMVAQGMISSGSGRLGEYNACFDQHAFIGKPQLDNIHKTITDINMEIFCNEADSLMQPGQSLKDKISDILKEKLGDECWKSIPDKEQKKVLDTLFNSMLQRILSFNPKLKEASEDISKNYGLIRDKNTLAKPKNTVEFKQILDMYENAINNPKFIENIKQENLRGSTIRGLKEVFKLNDAKTGFKYDDFTRDSFMNQLLTRITPPKASTLPIIPKYIDIVKPVVDLLYSKEKVSPKDLFDALKTYRAKVEQAKKEFCEADDIILKQKYGIKDENSPRYKDFLDDRRERNHDLEHFSGALIQAGLMKYMPAQKGNSIFLEDNSVKETLLKMHSELLEIQTKVSRLEEHEAQALNFLDNFLGHLNIQVINDSSIQEENSKGLHDRLYESGEDINIPMSQLTKDFVQQFGGTIRPVLPEGPQQSPQETIFKDRQHFLDVLRNNEYCKEPEMEDYAANLCMVDSSLQNVPPLAGEEKAAILEVLTKKGQELFNQANEANAQKDPNNKLLSPEELKKDSRFVKMPQVIRNVYESVYTDLAVKGQFNRDKMQYAMELLNGTYSTVTPEELNALRSKST